MPSIMARFPGPVNFDALPHRHDDSPPRASECGPILRLVARERKVALPFVLERLGDAIPKCAGGPPTCSSSSRTPRPSRASCRVFAIRTPARRASARTRSPPSRRLAPRTCATRVFTLARGAHRRRPRRGAHAMARAPRRDLVPELVRALGDAERLVVDAAHAALVQVTRQDFGTTRGLAELVGAELGASTASSGSSTRSATTSRRSDAPPARSCAR